MALRTAGPLKVWRLTERGRHELFFYRDLVIHATAEGCSGVHAVRRMLANHALPFSIEPGRWPSQHTMLIDWTQVMHAAQAARPVAAHPLEPVRYADESESTMPLGLSNRG